MWHVSSRSGVATLRTAIHLLLTYLLTYQGPNAGKYGTEYHLARLAGLCDLLTYDVRYAHCHVILLISSSKGD